MNVEVSSSVADLAITGALAIAGPDVDVDAWLAHLIPVVSLPKCATCHGDGYIGLGSVTACRCPDCTDGYPIGQRITLTTECRHCKPHEWGIWCDHGGYPRSAVPRATATLREVRQAGEGWEVVVTDLSPL